MISLRFMPDPEMIEFARGRGRLSRRTLQRIDWTSGVLRLPVRIALDGRDFVSCLGRSHPEFHDDRPPARRGCRRATTRARGSSYLPLPPASRRTSRFATRSEPDER
jgi:hypothetical protein